MRFNFSAARAMLALTMARANAAVSSFLGTKVQPTRGVIKNTRTVTGTMEPGHKKPKVRRCARCTRRVRVYLPAKLKGCPKCFGKRIRAERPEGLAFRHPALNMFRFVRVGK